MSADQEVTYSYRPSLMGAPWSFTLTEGGIRWTAGRRSGEVRYGAVRGVRMSYRPANMQSYRFMTEIWAEGAPRIRIASASWKSMFLQERQDEGYVAFVTALHERLARSAAPAVYMRGMSALQFWPFAAVFGVVALALVLLTGRAMQQGALGGAAFITAFLILFGWQARNFLTRNRPGYYQPDVLPPQLLPKA